jgi:hypothetical protein
LSFASLRQCLLYSLYRSFTSNVSLTPTKSRKLVADAGGGATVTFAGFDAQGHILVPTAATSVEHDVTRLVAHNLDVGIARVEAAFVTGAAQYCRCWRRRGHCPFVTITTQYRRCRRRAAHLTQSLHSIAGAGASVGAAYGPSDGQRPMEGTSRTASMAAMKAALREGVVDEPAKAIVCSGRSKQVARDSS